MTITIRSDVTVSLVPDSLAGSDALICKAARVSTLGSASAESGEARGLISYLMKNRHGSPFEHGSMTFLVEAPIFVAREFMRHRAGWSYNETSGRYRELEPVFHVPSATRPLVQVGKAGEYRFEPGGEEQHTSVLREHASAYNSSWIAYQRMLEAGVAKEVARSVLPVGTYTSFYATCNPRSLMHFLSLRTSHEMSHFPSFPQHEIADVAGQMEDYFFEHFPLTWETFNMHGRVAP